MQEVPIIARAVILSKIWHNSLLYIVVSRVPMLGKLIKSSNVMFKPDKSLVNATVTTASVQVVQYQVSGKCGIPVTVLLLQTHCRLLDGEFTLLP